MSINNRVRMVNFSLDRLIPLLQPLSDWPDVVRLYQFDGEGIPEDATIEYVFHKPENRCFSAVISHPSFAEVKECDEIPQQTVKLKQRQLHRTPEGFFPIGKQTEMKAGVVTDPRMIIPNLSTEVLNECVELIHKTLTKRHPSTGIKTLEYDSTAVVELIEGNQDAMSAFKRIEYKAMAYERMRSTLSMLK